MKRSAISKSAKKQTIGWYKKKLWTVFSKYIRQRDGYKCFTCDRTGTGSSMHAGHFIPKAGGGMSLYFHEDNVHSQCFHCNMNLGGNGAEYYKRMVEKFGQELVDELFRLKYQGFRKYTIDEYISEIEVYKKKIKEFET